MEHEATLHALRHFLGTVTRIAAATVSVVRPWDRTNPHAHCLVVTRSQPDDGMKCRKSRKYVDWLSYCISIPRLYRTGKPCKMRCDYGMVSLVQSRVIWKCVGREVTNPSSLRTARNCENTEERVLQEVRPSASGPGGKSHDLENSVKY